MEEEKKDQTGQKNNFLKYASNPKAFTVKKWLHQILENKYHNYESLAERVSTSLVTDKDLEEFGKLLADLYEAGFLKAMNQYKEQMDNLGIKVKIMSEDEVVTQNQDSPQK